MDRFSNVFRVSIVPVATPSPSGEIFEWSDEDHLTVYAGHDGERDVIEWEHGDIPIEPFEISHIKIRFYRDADATDEILSTDEDYYIGDQSLDEIITLDNLVEHGDGSGAVELVLDSTGITMEELMGQRQIHIVLEVDDPSP